MEQANTQETIDQPIYEEKLPNATLSLVMGILSILMACCCGPFALVPAIVGWIIGHKGVQKYKENPSLYTKSSYSNMNAGKITSIIGFILTVIVLIATYYSIQSVGGWDAYMEIVEETMKQYQ